MARRPPKKNGTSRKRTAKADALPSPEPVSIGVSPAAEPDPGQPPEKANNAAPVIEIRKYSNRRLYDTSSSRYVTLQELRDVIRAGAEIQVRDAQTGHDITRNVLLQIILENEQDMNLLPVSFLRQVIEAGSEAVTDSFRVTLTSSMEILSRLHEEFQAQVEEMTHLGAALPPLTLRWMSYMSRYFQNFSSMPLGFDEAPAETGDGADPERKKSQ